MIETEQIKAARAILNLSQKQLAQKAGVAVATLNNIERGAQKDPKISTVQAIRGALEADGIEFINESLGKIGILLKPKPSIHNESTLLIVDDNKADRSLYRRWLKDMPNKTINIFEAESAGTGFEAFLEHQPDCVILDFMMYGADGFQLLATLKREGLTIPPIIFVTGMHNEILEESAHSQGVHTYLNKQTMIKEDLYKAVMDALHG